MRTPITPAFTAAVLALCLLQACGVPRASLMVSPVIYHADDGLDPFAHLDERLRSPSESIFFATNRARASGRFDQPFAYSNTPTATLQVGKARVRFGDDVTWEDLHDASRAATRARRIDLRLTDVWEHGTIAFDEQQEHVPTPTDGSDAFFDEINAHLALARDPEIIIYVHGAKVNFYNACVYTAQLDHFTGRDMVAIAFAWPTHQDIFAYLSGQDVERAKQSAVALESFLHLLALKTNARRINIVCWSAGGRVVSRALEDLARWEDRLHEQPDAARLGTVLFAAPDVPVHDFVERLPQVERVAERVVITASDDDVALEKASQFMHGGQRFGSSASISDEERNALGHLSKVELIDVSHHKADRGFDIAGHRYWFDHDWVASDVVLAMRTRLPAIERGLAPTAIKNVWYLPIDYPRRVRNAAREALGSTW